MPLPERIETPRLILRPFVCTDGPEVLAYSQDEDWRRFQKTSPTSLSQAREVVETLRQRDWATEPAYALLHEGRTVGVTTLVLHSNDRVAHIGYGVHKNLRGRGLVGEALRAVLETAFAEYESLDRVIAVTHAQNVSSHALLHRLGFTLESNVRFSEASKTVDGAVFALLRSDRN